jgi:hypothetical protein
MLLLNRKTNESITTWVRGCKEAPLVIRVAEISPTGTVTLGFEGDTHTVCRTELFHNYYGDERYGNNGTKHNIR